MASSAHLVAFTVTGPHAYVPAWTAGVLPAGVVPQSHAQGGLRPGFGRQDGESHAGGGLRAQGRRIDEAVWVRGGDRDRHEYGGDENNCRERGNLGEIVHVCSFFRLPAGTCEADSSVPFVVYKSVEPGSTRGDELVPSDA